MLASITPLGQRGGRRQWLIAFAAFVMGATAAGVAVGWLLGQAGRMLAENAGVTADARLIVIAGLAAAAAAADTGLGSLHVPTIHRQVNQYWLTRYRPWVYGAGFGVQLGAGLSTVVITGLVYVTVATAAATASPLAGATVMGAFGLVRGLTLLPAYWVRSPRSLLDINRRLVAAAPAARALTIGASVAAACASALILIA